MPKTKRIVCPHCKSAHLPGDGYSFDENLSMTCDKCSKVIYPTTPEAEVGIPKLAERRYNVAYGRTNQWNPEKEASVSFT